MDALHRNSDQLYIIIIGCGRLGAYLANSLGRSKEYSVVVIDSKQSAFERLSEDFSGFTFEENALEMSVLENAKIKDADVVVVTTNEDNTNIMIAQISKGIFKVPQVIARIINPSKKAIYEELGIETISPTALSAIEFERIINESRTSQ